MWDKLKAQYEHIDMVSKVAIHEMLIQLTLQKTRSLIEFIEKWQESLDEAIVVKPKFQGKSKQYHKPSQYNASIE